MNNIKMSVNVSSEEKPILIKRSKHDRENPYVLIAKAMLHDGKLSIESKGLLTYLLALPDTWEIKASHICNKLGFGKGKFYRMINELIEVGYCERSQIKDKNNRYTTYQYTVSESPILKKCLPQTDFPRTDFPRTENTDTYRIESLENTDKKDILAPTNVDAKKSSSSKKSSLNQLPSLTKRRDNVFTSDEDHKKLTEKYGSKLTEEFYNSLSEWKTSKMQSDPKSVNKHSDYYRINKWVAKDVLLNREEKKKTPQKVDIEESASNRHRFELFCNSNKKIIYDKNITCYSKVNFAKIGNDEIYYDNPKFTDLIKHALKKIGLN